MRYWQYIANQRAHWAAWEAERMRIASKLVFISSQRSAVCAIVRESLAKLCPSCM